MKYKHYFQVDFSENAAIVEQDEVQSAHWSHAQATLFTAKAWVNTEVKEPYVIISDNLDHTKVAVFTYMDTILSNLRMKYPGIKTVHVFSDGASSQFKQRYLFANLNLWETKLKIKLEWNFFATSHGKGAVDGLGALSSGQFGVRSKLAKPEPPMPKNMLPLPLRETLASL